MEIQIKNELNRLNGQVALVCSLLLKKKTTEVLVLGCMLRYSISGIYLVKRGHIETIGRQVGKSSRMVKKSLQSLRKKGLVKFVGNGDGNGLGAYYFHKELEKLIAKESEITFKWI